MNYPFKNHVKITLCDYTKDPDYDNKLFLKHCAKKVILIYIGDFGEFRFRVIKSESDMRWIRLSWIISILNISGKFTSEQLHPVNVLNTILNKPEILLHSFSDPLQSVPALFYFPLTIEKQKRMI